MWDVGRTALRKWLGVILEKADEIWGGQAAAVNILNILFWLKLKIG